MIENHYKYTKYFGAIHYPSMPKLEDTLVDLRTDPNETTNIITDMADQAAEMRASIDEEINAHSVPKN